MTVILNECVRPVLRSLCAFAILQFSFLVLDKKGEKKGGVFLKKGSLLDRPFLSPLSALCAKSRCYNFTAARPPNTHPLIKLLRG